MKVCNTLQPLARVATAVAARLHPAALARAVAVAALVTAPLWAGPTAAHAAAPNEEAARTERYLGQLIDEINARRARAGTAPLAYATPAANDAVGQYLADLTPRMMAYNTCFHGSYNPVAPGWDYVAASGLRGTVGGEVIGCPDTNGYWTASKIADGWWNSPSHFRSLYGDPRANAVACGTYGPQKNGTAYQTIACITYKL